MLHEVYITRLSRFLPNKPVLNDEMEQYIGLINEHSAKSKRIVLRNNGIKCRYYALDKNGKATHTNSEMTALAIKELFANRQEEIKEVDLLSCGTSSPDQWMPSHAVMVHGWLTEAKDMEVVSPTGNCCSGMHALKYIWLAVKAGQSKITVLNYAQYVLKILTPTLFRYVHLQ